MSFRIIPASNHQPYAGDYTNALIIDGDQRYFYDCSGQWVEVAGPLDNNTTYTIETVAGVTQLIGSDGSSVALPDNDTKYSIVGNNLIGTDGTMFPIPCVCPGETVTTLVNNGDNTATYTSEDGTQLTFTLGSVSAFTADLTSGNKIGSHDDGSGTTVDLFETVTSVSYSSVTGEFTYTDEGGTVTSFTLPVATASSVTNTVTGNRIATHDDGAGNTTDINETVTSVNYNGSTGQLTFTDEAGDNTVITLPLENFLSSSSYDNNTNDLTLNLSDGSSIVVPLDDLVNVDTTYTVTTNTDGTVTFQGSDGTSSVIDICQIVMDNCGSTAVDNGDGTYTIEGNDGNSVTIDTNFTETTTTIVDNDDASFTYTNEAGTPVTVSLCDLVDDIADGTLAGGDKVFTLGDDGSCKLVENIRIIFWELSCFELGTPVECKTVRTFRFLDGDNNIVLSGGSAVELHIDEDGSNVADTAPLTSCACLQDLSIVTPIVTAGNQIAAHDDGSGTTTDIFETVTAVDYSPATQSITYTDENGVDTVLDLSGLVDDTNLARITSAGVDAAGLVTFTRDDASTFTLDLSTLLDDTNTTSAVTNVIAGNRIATHSDGDGNTVDINETITSISLAGTTLTYTDESGGTTDLVLPSGGTGNTSAMTQTVTSGNQIASHDDGNGATTSILETITTLTENAVTTPDVGGNIVSHTYTSEDGTAEVINSTVLLQDEDGRTAGVTEVASILGRTLHIQSPSHTTGVIDVSHADSDQTAVNGVTTTHNRTVISATNSTATGDNSLVTGNQNTASGDDSFSSGDRNNATGVRSGNFAGVLNTASGESSATVGAQQSTASGLRSVVAGGLLNTASAQDSSVVGGSNNQATAQTSGVYGGQNNVANGSRGVIAGGGFNNIFVTSNAFIGGGSEHNIAQNSNSFNSGVLAGGRGIIDGGRYSVLVGGFENTIDTAGTTPTVGSVISGGDNNSILNTTDAGSPWYHIISGGQDNTIDTVASSNSILGAQNSTITDTNIGDGTASVTKSAIIGGIDSTINAPTSFANGAMVNLGGQGIINHSWATVVMGTYNDDTFGMTSQPLPNGNAQNATDYAYLIGNGDSVTRSNAFGVTWEGGMVFQANTGAAGPPVAPVDVTMSELKLFNDILYLWKPGAAGWVVVA